MNETLRLSNIAKQSSKCSKLLATQVIEYYCLRRGTLRYHRSRRLRKRTYLHIKLCTVLQRLLTTSHYQSCNYLIWKARMMTDDTTFISILCDRTQMSFVITASYIRRRLFDCQESYVSKEFLKYHGIQKVSYAAHNASPVL